MAMETATRVRPAPDFGAIVMVKKKLAMWEIEVQDLKIENPEMRIPMVRDCKQSALKTWNRTFGIK